jgi:heat shock protein HtpX
MTMKNQLKTILLMGAFTALLVGFGALVAPGYLYGFGALALLLNLGAYFYSDRVILRMSRAKEVADQEAPELHAMLEELARRAGIPRPRLFVIDDPQPNAFATGRDPAHGVVAVTTGIVRILDRRELRAVLAHELAHIRNRDVLLSSIAAAGATMISLAANALSLGSLLGAGSQDEEGGAAGGLVAALVAPIAATLIQLGISRSREHLADETGAAICGDPEALARALLKLEQAATLLPAQAAPATASLYIVNPFAAAERLSRWFSTHPSTADRVARLRSMRIPRGRF